MVVAIGGAPNRKMGLLIQLKDLKNTLQIKEITLENDLAKKLLKYPNYYNYKKKK